MVSPMLKCLPAEIVSHDGQTAHSGKIVGNESGGSPLHGIHHFADALIIDVEKTYRGAQQNFHLLTELLITILTTY